MRHNVLTIQSRFIMSDIVKQWHVLLWKPQVCMISTLFLAKMCFIGNVAEKYYTHHNPKLKQQCL